MINEGNLLPSVELNFQRQYQISKAQIDLLWERLNTQTFEGLFKDNPANYIISIRGYPFYVYKLFNTRTLRKLKIGGVSLSDDIKGNVEELTDKKPFIDMGSVQFVENTQNDYKFLNYSPFTTIECYLPYIGFTTLPTNEVMGKTIAFYYAIDTFSGDLTCYVWNTTDDYCILTTTGRVGIDINVGSSNAQDRFRTKLMTGAQGIGGSLLSLATGNIMGAVSAGANAFNSIMNNTEKITKGQIGEGINALTGNQNIIITIERPIIPTQYFKQFKGRPLLETRLLSDLSGYTLINDIHLEGFDNATLQELNEIENLLKNGVIL